MNFIKDVFEGRQEQDYIHQKFVRYGRGDFEGPIIEINRSGDKIKVNASYDYVNILVCIIANNLEDNVNVKGDIISREDFNGVIEKLEFPFKNYSKKKKQFHAKINSNVETKKLRKLCSELKNANLLLDLSSENCKLKTKKRLPKPGSSLDEKFCSMTVLEEIDNCMLDEIVFGLNIKNFDAIRIRHRYIIDELRVPEEYSNNPSLARINAKRIGKILRFVEVDGKRWEMEHSLNV
ncbi:MAG TPA: hypothetical protein EYP86_03080 [Candidatus Altiarchaeales archaeon]|nr:hypothetical protein [Candidatus Altiarchaeales archaeon]